MKSDTAGMDLLDRTIAHRLAHKDIGYEFYGRNSNKSIWKALAYIEWQIGMGREPTRFGKGLPRYYVESQLAFGGTLQISSERQLINRYIEYWFIIVGELKSKKKLRKAINFIAENSDIFTGFFRYPEEKLRGILGVVRPTVGILASNIEKAWYDRKVFTSKKTDVLGTGQMVDVSLMDTDYHDLIAQIIQFSEKLKTSRAKRRKRQRRSKRR